MFDVTAGRSAGSAENERLDPMRAQPSITQPLEDVTAGRAAGTPWNALQDPTRAVTVDDPRR